MYSLTGNSQHREVALPRSKRPCRGRRPEFKRESARLAQHRQSVPRIDEYRFVSSEASNVADREAAEVGEAELGHGPDKGMLVGPGVVELEGGLRCSPEVSTDGRRRRHRRIAGALDQAESQRSRKVRVEEELVGPEAEAVVVTSGGQFNCPVESARGRRSR